MSGFLEALNRADQQATLAINSLHTPFTDGIWLLFSDKMVWVPLYLALVLLLFWRLPWKKALAVLLSVALTVAACDQLSALVKDAVCRLRPCWDNYMVQNGLHRLEGKGNYYGFFSAHAANVFGVVSCLMMGLKQDRLLNTRAIGWILYAWAALVSVSRIFVGKHYLGDVLVGICAGLLLGWAIGALTRLIIRKF